MSKSSLPRPKTKVLTGRDARRYKERDERRAIAEIPEWKRREIAARAAVTARMSVNGITPDDLRKAEDKAYKTGFDEGFKSASENIVRGIYAGICLALNDLHGFGKKRCCDVLKAVDDLIIYQLDSEESINEVFDRMGLRINFNDPLDRIETVEEDDEK